MMMDMLTVPDKIHKAMGQTTKLWKYVMDVVSDIILPAGQGTSNWTMGWSGKKYSCIGQNDFSCMISPEMFAGFCFEDNLQCCNYSDYSIYHLDGPDAVKHVPKLLELEKLSCIQWVEGAGNPSPSNWIELLRKIQKGGKTVQVLYLPTPSIEPPDLKREFEILCTSLDITKLFIWMEADSRQHADEMVAFIKEVCRGKNKK